MLAATVPLNTMSTSNPNSKICKQCEQVEEQQFTYNAEGNHHYIERDTKRILK